MSGECRSVLHASFVAMFRHAWQVQQQSEARHAFYQGADRGTAKAQDEIPFPVARHGAINCPSRALAYHDLGRDEGLASPARTRSRYPQHPPGAQAGRQLAPQRATTLNEQRLIDGFMADAHGLIVREVDRQAASNLLGLQALAHRRCFRGPCRRPFQRTAGPGTGAPLEVTTTPANRSST